MSCEEVETIVETTAFQALLPADVDAIERHISEGCPDCVFQHRAALMARRTVDTIRERAAENSSAPIATPFRIVGLRLLAGALIVAALGLLLEQGLRISRYSYEKKFVQRLQKAIILYRLETGVFPPQDRPLSQIVQEGAPGGHLDLRAERIDVRGDFIDHWGNVYRYRVPGVHNPKLFDLWSAGRNRRDDRGRRDDITNWGEYNFAKVDR